MISEDQAPLARAPSGASRFVRAMVALFLGFALLTSFTPDAAAQSKSDKQQAQKHFEKGAEWYTAGEYSKAIVEFLNGYHLAPNAMFLYNISLSYAKIGNTTDALGAAVKAQSEEGMPPKVERRNQARIEAFSLVLRAERAAKNIKDAEPVVQLEPEPEPEPKKKVESGFGALGWSGVALTAVGAGLGVGSIIVAGGVQDNIDLYEATDDVDEYNRLQSDIESGQSTGKLLLYSGIGLMSAGAVMIIVELLTGGESESEETSSIFVLPTEGGTQAGYFLQF